MKPSKVLTSLDFDSNSLFLTDYKYSKMIKDQNKKKTDDLSKKKYLLNKFSSLNAHLGISNKNYFTKKIEFISIFIKLSINSSNYDR